MKETTFNWTTTHSDDRMVHNFDNGFQIVVDKKTQMAYKLNLDDVKDSFSIVGMLLGTYEQILTNFAKLVNSAMTLERQTADGVR